MIDKSQYTDWKQHPVTREYFSNLKDAKDQFEDKLLYGHNIENHALMAQSIGILRAYDSAINYSPEFNDQGYMVDDFGEVVE